MHLRNDRAFFAILATLFFLTVASANPGAPPQANTQQHNQSTFPPQPPVSSVPPPAPVPLGTQPTPSSQKPSTGSTSPSQGSSSPSTSTTPPASAPPSPSTPTAQNSPSSTGTQQQQAPPSSGIGAGEGPGQAPPPITPPPSPVRQARCGGTQEGQTQGQAPPPNQQNTQENGQDQQPSNEGGAFVFRAEVQEVMLHATVLDDKQRLVTNLDKTAFSIFENNQPQTIKSFRHEDIPVAMGIVIDNSGSMRDKRERVNKAAINLVRASNPNDQVFVVNFNDEYYLDQDFTSNIKKLQEGLEKVESRGGTALYDAIVASADHLKKNAKLEKKVLFVVTDGEDNASRESLEQAIQRLQQ